MVTARWLLISIFRAVLILLHYNLIKMLTVMSSGWETSRTALTIYSGASMRIRMKTSAIVSSAVLQQRSILLEVYNLRAKAPVISFFFINNFFKKKDEGPA